jgi:hypothetical protein
MTSRLLLMVTMVIGLVALSRVYLIPTLEVAEAQSNDDLLLTVTALQTQVANQERRIAKLEEAVARLDEGSTQTGVSEDADGEERTITGSITLSSFGETDISEWSFLYPAFGPGDCIGKGGYDDITVGAGVVIVDGTGTTIAVGHLGEGIYDKNATSCTFDFTVEDVPSAKFYSIRIGRRGGPTFSLEELEELDWTMDLSLG